MAVTAARVAATSAWSANQDKDGKISVTVPYYVTSDDLADGPLTVLGASGLPAINSALSAGNESNDFLFCQGRTPSKVTDGSGQWIVNCTFATEEEKQGQDGEATDDPEQWQPNVQISSVGFQKPMTDVKWVPRENQLVPGRENGEKGPVLNTAGDVIYPIPSQDDVRQQIRFTKYYLFLDATTFDLYVPSVNVDEFSIDKYYNGVLVFSYSVNKGQLKLSSLDVQFEIHTVAGVATMYNKVSLVCEINQDGWNHKEVDRGQHAKAAAGDPDGRGGTVSQADIVDGAPEKRAIAGVDGVPMIEANLNGFGFPLPEHIQQQVTLEYEQFPERVLGPLFGVILPPFPGA